MKYKKVGKVVSGRYQQFQNFWHKAELAIDRLLFSRFTRLVPIRRFIAGWLIWWLLLTIIIVWQTTSLAGYFQTIKYVPGGIYSEGILGTMTNVNPIYATNIVDTSLSKLIFAGLLTYNSQNQLVDCLASGYSVNSQGTTYTVKLKPNLKWQDGQPLTSADVVYTIDTIQNINAQSPFYSSWQDIKVSAPNPLTVLFKLPNPLASFPYNLTIGIIPKHILSKIPIVDLRSAAFNVDDPIGAGPFKWRAIQVIGNTPQNANEQIALAPFRDYALGKPKIGEFIISAFANKNQLINAFNSGQLTAVAGLDSVPKDISHKPSTEIHSILLTAGNYVFFKTNSGVLADVNVRRALVLGSNPKAIIDSLSYITLPVNEPLLIGQLAYNPKYAQVTNKLSQAKQLLTQDGWQIGSGGYRYKNKHMLSFNLVTTNTSENHLVVGLLTAQWRLLGVKVKPIYESGITYSTTLQDHNYNATLDGIDIGVDPDVFVYWDSSQYDPRSTGLNLSDYNNANADQALEAGRTRLNPALRVIKYQPFLADWQKDAPALGLYQPRVIYITRQNIHGLIDHQINSAKDIFNNVQNWEILTANVTDPKP